MHLNIPNEIISGKNNLLTSSKTLGPASNQVNKTINFNLHSENDKKINETKLKKTHSNENLNCKSSQGCKTYGAVKQFNRRSFLAGLINARKRRAEACFSWRKKRRKKIKRIRLSDSCSKNDISGLNEMGMEKPDAEKENFIRSYGTNTNVDASLDGKSAIGLRENNEIDKSENENANDLKIKGIKLKIKRVEGNKLKLVNSDSESLKTNKPNEFTEESNTIKCIVNKELAFSSDDDTNVKDDDDDDVLKVQKQNESKTDNVENYKVSTGDKELLSGKMMIKTVIKTQNGELSVESTENEGTNDKKLDKELKCEISLRDMPKSCVLLENVCRRKEIYNKYVRKTNNGGINDEIKEKNVNVSASEISIRSSKLSKKKRKRKRGSKLKKVKEGRRRRRRATGKKVRFENAIVENWITPCDGDDDGHDGEDGDEYSNVLVNSHRSKIKDERSKKKQMKKYRLVHCTNDKKEGATDDDGCGKREENSLVPQNNSVLGEFFI